MAILWAYFNIPKNQVDTFSRCEEHHLLIYPSIISSMQTTDLKVNLRSNSEGKHQIEVIVLQPLIGAANQLYVSNLANKPQQILLGSLESKGVLLFPCT